MQCVKHTNKYGTQTLINCESKKQVLVYLKNKGDSKHIIFCPICGARLFELGYSERESR